MHPAHLARALRARAAVLLARLKHPTRGHRARARLVALILRMRARAAALSKLTPTKAPK